MVKAWREKVVIPTYEAGKPEKNPVFLEKRVYQGSSGVVYPYPVIEHIADECTDHEYNAVFLENEYLKIMILPELGGRVQMAYDKIAGPIASVVVGLFLGILSIGVSSGVFIAILEIIVSLGIPGLGIYAFYCETDGFYYLFNQFDRVKANK